MNDQSFAGGARTFVAGEVDEFSGYDSRLSGLENRAFLAFDFHDQAAFDHMQQFLRAGMDVPRRRAPGRKFDEADDGFLDHLPLPLEIVAQNLRQLWSCLRL